VSLTTRSSEATASAISITGVVKSRPGVQILGGVTFAVAAGETVAIVGPSGAGKSTLLNIAAGLLPADSGEITVLGASPRAANRAVGYLTQKDTLFPWRTAVRNVELPLQIAGHAPPERRHRALEMLERFGLADVATRYPHQLSGGMRHRVALARMLATDPAALLLDEPFTALDARTRLTLQADLTRLAEDGDRSVLLVTHDLEEAIAVADRVLVLRGAPAVITAELRIPFGKPRDVRSVRFSGKFPQIHQRLWEELGDD